MMAIPLLFPGQAVLQERDKWVSAYYLESQSMFRITLTAPIINRAKEIVVITFGENKARALNEVLHGDYNPKIPYAINKTFGWKIVILD
jgi:6-phosphogluconolactonase